MSYFTDGTIYIIIPIVDITNEMENNVKKGFNSTIATSRKSLDGTLVLCKLKEPISNAFNGFVWLNKKDIKKEMAKAEWQIAIEE